MKQIEIKTWSFDKRLQILKEVQLAKLRTRNDIQGITQVVTYKKFKSKLTNKLNQRPGTPTY
jgi:hypothetical protein